MKVFCEWGWLKFVANQLQHPRGLFGRAVMARRLNRGSERLALLGLIAVADV